MPMSGRRIRPPPPTPSVSARLKEGLEKHCPGMIIQFLGPGGRSGAGRERGGMLPLRPDMASLTVGYQTTSPPASTRNPPDLVDWLASEMLTHEVKPEIEGLRPEPHLPGGENGRGRAACRARSTCNSSWA